MISIWWSLTLPTGTKHLMSFDKQLSREFAQCGWSAACVPQNRGALNASTVFFMWSSSVRRRLESWNSIHPEGSLWVGIAWWPLAIFSACARVCVCACVCIGVVMERMVHTDGLKISSVLPCMMIFLLQGERFINTVYKSLRPQLSIFCGGEI